MSKPEVADDPLRSEDASLEEKLAAYSGYGSLTPREALALLEQARDKCPVAHSDQLGGFHIVFDYEDAKRVHLDAETFSSADGMFRPVVERFKLPPTEFDDPEHAEWRKAVFDPVVNVKTPLRIEDAVRQDANDAIDRFAGRGSCELLADYASEIPLKAICRIVGFDVEKGPELQRLTDDLVINLGNPEAAASASKALADACVEEIEDRRKNPRDDFLTQLLHAEMWGRPITQDEIGHSVASLVAAGHQTAVSGLVNLLYEVLSRPSIKQRLIDDPKLIPAAVEESLRLNPVSMGFYRRATKPTTIRDVKINKDEQVMMCWATANRDPKRYNDPDSFELDRVRKRHLTFGLGLHVCIGAPVARMELRIAVEELLRRLPDIEFADPDAIERVFGGIEFVMIPALPAKFTPVAV